MLFDHLYVIYQIIYKIMYCMKISWKIARIKLKKMFSGWRHKAKKWEWEYRRQHFVAAFQGTGHNRSGILYFALLMQCKDINTVNSVREKIPLTNEQNFETSNSIISVSPNKLSKLSPTLPSQNSHAHPYKPEASWLEMNYLSKMEGYPLPSQAPFAGTGMT